MKLTGLLGLWLLLGCFCLEEACAQDVLLNEVLSSNDLVSFDDEGEFDDWIELYRPAGLQPAAFNLAGYYLSDNKSWLTKFQIPDSDPQNTTILSGQHLIFWCDKDTLAGADHTNFKLSADGEKLYITEPDGVTIADSLWYGDQATDISLGRQCDGCEDWVYFNIPTPDAPNEVLPEGPWILFVNEVMPTNTDYFDDPYNEFDPWMEIHNPNVEQVNLAGWQLDYSGDGVDYVFPADDPTKTVVPGNGHLVVWCDNQSAQGNNHAPALLSVSGGTIALLDPEGNQVDGFAYPALGLENSYGRSTDGDDAFTYFDQPTPLLPNDHVFVPSPALFINEFMPDNETDTADVNGGHPDWFELYNPNPFEVDLAHYYLSDNLDNRVKWRISNLVLGDSTVMEPFGYMLFWADEDQYQGWNHTNFRLKDSGEELGLYSPDGFTICDEISWGDVTVPNDISMGRQTDGGEPWVWFANPTPEYSNNGQPTGMPLQKPVKALLYPNPVRGTTVWFDQAYDGQVWSLSGQRIGAFEQVSWLDVTRWESGVYLVQFHGVGVRRLVVE